MPDPHAYTSGPAHGAHVDKKGDKWTLILTRDLRHAPEKVWIALTHPEHLRAWAPFDVEGNLETPGATISLKWAGTGQVTEAKVTRVEAPFLLEFGDLRWQLEPVRTGTRITLWHQIDRRFIAWGAAGWHICFNVLARLMDNEPIGRLIGPDAMKLPAWQHLVAEYTQQFEAEPPPQPLNAIEHS